MLILQYLLHLNEMIFVCNYASISNLTITSSSFATNNHCCERPIQVTNLPKWCYSLAKKEDGHMLIKVVKRLFWVFPGTWSGYRVWAACDGLPFLPLIYLSLSLYTLSCTWQPSPSDISLWSSSNLHRSEMVLVYERRFSRNPSRSKLRPGDHHASSGGKGTQDIW